VIANIVFHDLVASPAPHDLLDYHRPHEEWGEWVRVIKEEMRGNVKPIVERARKHRKRERREEGFITTIDALEGRNSILVYVSLLTRGWKFDSTPGHHPSALNIRGSSRDF